MSESLSECGIILKKIPYAESDEILVALLEHQGVTRFFARGARASKKRFGGRTDVFRHSLFVFKPGREGRQLATLTGLEDVPDQPSAQRALESNLVFYAALSYLAEIIVEFLPEAAPSPLIYQHWMNVIRDGEQGEFSWQRLTRHILGFLAEFGFACETNHCVICQKPAAADLFFDPKRGGVFHAVCLRSVPMNAFSEQEWQAFLLDQTETDGVAQVSSRVLVLLLDFVRHNLQKPLRTESFLRSFLPV